MKARSPEEIDRILAEIRQHLDENKRLSKVILSTIQRKSAKEQMEAGSLGGGSDIASSSTRT